MAAVQSASTGFLYDAGGSVPVCCTPEFLSAYGVGLDSTYGDGVVEGVLREDQAEAAFMGLFPDEYQGVKAASGQLETLTSEIKTLALGLEDGTNLFDLAKEAGNYKDNPDENENASAEAKQLATIMESLDTLVDGNPELKTMLTNFFGEDTLDEEGSIGQMMASTVITGYDVRNDDDGGDGANGRDDLTMDAEDKAQLQAGEQPRVALGEIVQWSLEANAFMGLYKAGGNGQSLADFTQTAFTAVSEGTITDQTFPGYTAEQVQVLVSVMMNNHSNLMSTTGNFANSGKNGAHEYLNNVGGGNRAFNMLHIGNLGTTNDMEDGQVNDGDGNAGAAGDASNENMNEVVAERANGAGSIFYAGDNANGANGGFNDLTADQNYIDNYDSPMAINPTAPGATPILGDPLAKQELLAGLSEMGGGVIGGTTAAQSVTIGDVTADVSIEQSEDFENEGYDVVIVTLTDPTTGAVMGSMTATEAMDPTTNEPKLVEFADKNGDGVVDAVDAKTGLSQEAFDANGTSILTYNDADSEAGSGMVDWDATGAPETLGGLAMNESEDDLAAGWQPIAGFGTPGAAGVGADATPPAINPLTGLPVAPAAGTPPAINPLTGLPVAPAAGTPAAGTPTDGTAVTWNGAATPGAAGAVPGAAPAAAAPIYTPNGDGTYAGPGGQIYVIDPATGAYVPQA